MGIEVKKQERETPQSLIRRFTKRVQKSGVLLWARTSRYHKRSKSRQMKKRAALRREELRKEYQKLKKLGLTEK
jgi:ribosomal protein S21